MVESKWSGRIYNWKTNDATLAILDDEIIFAVHRRAVHFILIRQLINLGSLGFVSFNATTGTYNSHSSIYSSSGGGGSCNSVVQHGSNYTTPWLVVKEWLILSIQFMVDNFTLLGFFRHFRSHLLNYWRNRWWSFDVF